MHVIPYSAKFWRGKTLANRSFQTFGEENVGELTIANNIISYFSESGIWLGKILANDVQFAKFAKVFPRQNFALYGINYTCKLRKKEVKKFQNTHYTNQFLCAGRTLQCNNVSVWLTCKTLHVLKVLLGSHTSIWHINYMYIEIVNISFHQLNTILCRDVPTMVDSNHHSNEMTTTTNSLTSTKYICTSENDSF